MIERLEPNIGLRGLGLIWGIDFTPLKNPQIIDRVTQYCFEHQLIVETAGRQGQVIKLLPALTTSKEELSQGLGIIEQAVKQAL